MKKFLSLVLLITAILSLSCFAEEGIFMLEKIGEYQKFATQKQIIPPPRGSAVTVYNNFGIMDRGGESLLKTKV